MSRLCRWFMGYTIKCRSLFVTSPRIRISLQTLHTYDHSLMIPNSPPHSMWRGTLRNMWSRVLCATIFLTPITNDILVQLALDGDEDETWEPFEVLKDIAAFHTYCAANGTSTLFPRKYPACAGLNITRSGPTLHYCILPPR